MEIQSDPATNPNQQESVPFQITNNILLGLLRVGHDTLQIAAEFGMSEAEVYNRIHLARRREADVARYKKWRDANPDRNQLYRWKAKMRGAGMSEAAINDAIWGATK